MSLYIPIILGTARVGRKSELVANYVLEFVKKLGVETELLDVKNFPQTYTQEKTEAIATWQAKAEQADAYIIVTPEYNHGYPGELKLFLDNVYLECNRKPLGLVGVSSGPFGGARAIEQLKAVAVEFQLLPLKNSVYFGNVMSLFDDSGELKDQATWDKKLTQLTTELLWYAKLLQAGRQELTKV